MGGWQSIGKTSCPHCGRGPLHYRILFGHYQITCPGGYFVKGNPQDCAWTADVINRSPTISCNCGSLSCKKSSSKIELRK